MCIEQHYCGTRPLLRGSKRGLCGCQCTKKKSGLRVPDSLRRCPDQDYVGTSIHGELAGLLLDAHTHRLIEAVGVAVNQNPVLMSAILHSLASSERTNARSRTAAASDLPNASTASVKNGRNSSNLIGWTRRIRPTSYPTPSFATSSCTDSAAPLGFGTGTYSRVANGGGQGPP